MTCPEQRLMVARALVCRPRIVFLDEATSALDNPTQRVVAESIRKLNASRVVIAHRLSTVTEADKIIVLDGGKVVQQGAPRRAAPGADPRPPGAGRDAIWQSWIERGYTVEGMALLARSPALRAEQDTSTPDRVNMLASYRATVDPSFTQMAENYLT